MPDNSDILTALFQEIAYSQSVQNSGLIVKRVRVNPDKIMESAPLIRLGKQISGGGDLPQLLVRSLNTIVLDSGNLTFPGSTPVNMSGNLTLLPDGNWNFTVHMHNSGFPSYKGQLMFGIIFHGISQPDPVVVKQVEGNMGGTFGGNRSFDTTVSSPGPNPALKDLMSRANGYDWTIDYSVNWDLPDMLNDVKTAIGAAASVVPIFL